MDTNAQGKPGTKETETASETFHFIFNRHRMTGLSHCIVTEVAATAAEVCQLPVHPAAVVSSPIKILQVQSDKVDSIREVAGELKEKASMFQVAYVH